MTGYLENGSSRLIFTEQCAALDLSVQMICATINLKPSADEVLLLPITCRRCLLTSRHFPDQNSTTQLKSRKIGAQSFSCCFLGLNLYHCDCDWHLTSMCTTRWLRERNLRSCSALKKSTSRRFLFLSDICTCVKRL